MARKTIALLLLMWPIALGFALPAYLILVGRVGETTAWWLAAFALGPLVTLVGHRLDSEPLGWAGLVLYVLNIALWGFSWGVVHLWGGLPAFIVSLALWRPHGRGFTGRMEQA